MSTLTPEKRTKKRALAKRLMEKLQHHVLICEGHCCQLRADPQEVVRSFKEAILTHSLEEHVRVSTTSCLHRYGDACTVAVYPEGIWYQHITGENAKQIVSPHLLDKQPVTDRLTYQYDGEKFVSVSETKK